LADCGKRDNWNAPGEALNVDDDSRGDIWTDVHARELGSVDDDFDLCIFDRNRTSLSGSQSGDFVRRVA
jgi:hypothetical protein